MPAKSDPREDSAADRYYYRRSLSARDLLPALAAGVAAGIAAFYLASVLKQRTALEEVGRQPRRRKRAADSRPRGG